MTNFMLSRVEHEKSFITSRPDCRIPMLTWCMLVAYAILKVIFYLEGLMESNNQEMPYKKNIFSPQYSQSELIAVWFP